MNLRKQQNLIITIAIVVAILLLSGCLTSQKIDKYVGTKFNNELPKPDKKTSDISITSAVSFNSDNISATETKTSHMLPLLFYWQWDYKNTCTLNPAIPVNTFRKAFLSQANKGLNQKLNGQKLELTLEELPHAFAFDDKAHMVWVIYAFGWDKISVQPDVKDMVVSYKVLQNGSVTKSGRITIKNNEKNRGLRFFQSWKSAISEYLEQYNDDMTAMGRSCATQLSQELYPAN